MCVTPSCWQTRFYILRALIYKMNWVYLVHSLLQDAKGRQTRKRCGWARNRGMTLLSAPDRGQLGGGRGDWDGGEGNWGPLHLPGGSRVLEGGGTVDGDPTLPCPRTGARCPCTPPPRRTGSTPSRASRGLCQARRPAQPGAPMALACPPPTGVLAAAAAAVAAAVAAAAATPATARLPLGAPGRRAAASCLACQGPGPRSMDGRHQGVAARWQDGAAQCHMVASARPPGRRPRRGTRTGARP